MSLQLKPEVKAAWVKALRSRKYKQGRGWLNRDGKMCCLGVLCDLAVQAGVTEESGRVYSGAVRYGPKGEAIILPPEVQEWAFGDVSKNHDDMPSNPRVDGYPLATYNDGQQTDEYDRAPRRGIKRWEVRPLGFRAIADLIEEHL